MNGIIELKNIYITLKNWKYIKVIKMIDADVNMKEFKKDVEDGLG